MQFVKSIKSILAEGVLCCLVLLAAYLFQVYGAGRHAGVFPSFLFSFMWLLLFLVLWSIREKRASGLSSEVNDWSWVSSFLLIVGDQVFILTPKDYRLDLTPVLPSHTYTLLALIVVGLTLGVIIKLFSSLSRLLETERARRIFREKRLAELLSSRASVRARAMLVRRLFENQSLGGLSDDEWVMLLTGCRSVDPVLFAWLQERQINLPPRHIVYCMLVRMRKNKKEILSVLDFSDSAYRTLKSRLRARLGIQDRDLETFLQELHKRVR